MNRRHFLRSSTAAGISLALGGFNKLAAVVDTMGSLPSFKAYGFGELVPTAAKNTGENLLLLPPGFEYNVFGRKGDIMKDGRPTPARHDGMATFEIGKELRLVRNHEINDDVPKDNVAIGSANHYDEAAGGGTTTLVIDPRTNLPIKDFVSLSGTLNNCAGGATPWGSWISCEETTLGKTKITDDKGKTEGGYDKPHGYCFEVPASSNSNLPAVPLKAMGRFSHEAVAFDSKSGIVYQTEDASPKCGFYRFLPNRKGRLSEGGTLQMLTIKDKPNYDTRKDQKPGTSFASSWVTIDRPDPEEADVDGIAVYKQGENKGAAIFRKLEGAFVDKNGRVFFVSSSGGDSAGGQVWLYEPNSKNDGRLTLFYESPSRQTLDMPDNICIHSKTGLLFMCEDSNYAELGGVADNFMRILTPSGKIADFAKNITPTYETSEFAGSAFSKNGKTLFVNIQDAGVTLAIWGDWNRFKA